jgi:hypothetical protein
MGGAPCTPGVGNSKNLGSAAHKDNFLVSRAYFEESAPIARTTSREVEGERRRTEPKHHGLGSSADFTIGQTSSLA